MDPGDDDALSWAGDEDLEPRRATPVASAERDGGEDDEPPGGRSGPVLAVLFVALLVETALWAQSVFAGPLASTLGAPGGSAVEGASWTLVLVVRIAGVLSPIVWAAVSTRLVADRRRRAAVLLTGVVLLLPWPALVRLL